MDNAYSIVVGMILLFPWSVVIVMMTGTLWGKIKTFVRLGDRGRDGKPLLEAQSDGFHLLRATTGERQILPPRSRESAISR